MKSVKLISLAIAMLFCIISIAQVSDKDTSVKSYGQLDTIKKPEAVNIRIGRPANISFQPLYILDGKPVSAEEVQKINPETIESVTVLKDSTKIQLCNRITDGVIIIKTKRFSKRELMKMKKKE